MHQNIPLSSVPMSRLSDGSRTGALRRRTDNAVSARHESRRDVLLEWPQTHEAEGAPVERLPYLQGMPLNLQSLFRARQGRPHTASTAARMGLVYGSAAKVSVWPCSAGRAAN
jgi:hypothetical protein